MNGGRGKLRSGRLGVKSDAVGGVSVCDGFGFGKVMMMGGMAVDSKLIERRNSATGLWTS